MLRQTHFILQCWLVLCLCLAPAQAQQKPQTKVSIRLLAYQRSSGQRTAHFYHPDGRQVDQVESSDLPLHQLTDPIRLETRHVILLPEPLGGKREEFARIKPLAEIKLPPAGKHFIVVLFPAPADAKATYNVVAFEAPPDRFKGGSYLLVNTSDTAIAGKFGSNKIELRPGARQLIDIGKNTESGSTPLVLHQWDVKSEAWSKRPFVSIPVSPSNRRRELVFFFKDPTSHKLLWRGVRDLLPAPQDPE